MEKPEDIYAINLSMCKVNTLSSHPLEYEHNDNSATGGKKKLIKKSNRSRTLKGGDDMVTKFVSNGKAIIAQLQICAPNMGTTMSMELLQTFDTKLDELLAHKQVTVDATSPALTPQIIYDIDNGLASLSAMVQSSNVLSKQRTNERILGEVYGEIMAYISSLWGDIRTSMVDVGILIDLRKPLEKENAYMFRMVNGEVKPMGTEEAYKAWLIKNNWLTTMNTGFAFLDKVRQRIDSLVGDQSTMEFERKMLRFDTITTVLSDDSRVITYKVTVPAQAGGAMKHKKVKATAARVKIGKRNAVVYESSRGKKYVKKGGEFVALKDLLAKKSKK